jgi:transposase
VKPYSIEFREEVLSDCDAGMGTLAVAIKRNVSESWVRRLKQRRRETGEVAARPPKKKTQPKWRAYTEEIHAILREQPDITLRELRDELGIETSLQTLSVALRTLQYTLKKSVARGRARPPRRRREASAIPAAAGRSRSGPPRVPR